MGCAGFVVVVVFFLFVVCRMTDESLVLRVKHNAVETAPTSVTLLDETLPPL